MMKSGFFRDDSARVPFAVIGIFMILISTLISINLSRLDVTMAKARASGSEIAAPDTALRYAKADLSRTLNYAGMEALKTLGETPVIRPDNNSIYFDTVNPAEFNKNCARAIIKNTLDQYIESNYMYEAFVHDGFSVNVEPPGSWKEIRIEPIKMKLDRSLDPPILKPGDGKYSSGYETYWKISVPLMIHLKDMSTGSELLSNNITIETVITSRYPLLKDLTDEYSERLNGSNATMVEATAFTMAYTWGRGYMQYYKQTPLNIVNNTHLALIMNGALLLDQGFVFNSVDPISLFEYASETEKTLTGKKKEYQNVSLDGGSLNIDPQQDAFNSTDDPDAAKEGAGRAKQFDINATPIIEYLNNDSIPSGSIVKKQILTIIPEVYSAKLSTVVDRQTTQITGSHDGYESSDRVEEWGEPDTMELIEIFPEEKTVPGNLNGEKWKGTWRRTHFWRHYYMVHYSCIVAEVESTCSRQEYNEMTTTDIRIDVVSIFLRAKENSGTDIHLNYANKHLSSLNDVDNVFHMRSISYPGLYTDPELEEACEKYKNEIFDPNKIGNIKNLAFSGEDYVRTYSSGSSSPYQIRIPGWVEQEAENAVDDISDEIRNDIHLSPDINYATYPVPSDLLIAARDDLIRKIERNESGYVNKERYFSGGLYTSTSSKVISSVREWYVDEVKYRIRVMFTGGSDQINEMINKNFSEPEKIKQSNRDGAKFLSRGLKLPLGLAMRAYHVDADGNIYRPEELQAWNESVTLMVDQEPDYLSADRPYGEEKLYTLKLRNNDLLGGNGVHILPTFDPWIMTVNAWSIDVEGEFVKFEVQDVDNEVHPNPVFGHEAQVYVREADTVEDIITHLPLGDNLPLKFNFTTGTFIAVPPGKINGIGDKDGIIIEESAGYKMKK
ncbi:MAG: hypothetical protein J5U19_14730 [Candidatus Methanoperedens sp.]|nr:hypothetical protein [Candidatus Methanoperedens sp.]